MANPIVSAITGYVDQQRLPLIAKSVLGAKSAKLFTLQSGVKSDTALNLINTDIVFGDGSACGWNESGSTTYSQRLIKPRALKVNMSYCDKAMLKTWANYEVKVAAGDKNLPFEEDFTNGIVEGVKEAVEKMIYQGSSANTTEFGGMLEILNADVPSDNVVTTAAGTSAYAFIKDVYATMPERVLEKDDAVILVGAGLFRKFIQELVSANLYHYEASDTEGEYKLPGTNCRVISVNGLNDTADYDYAIAGRLSNMFYGTDMEGDEEKFDLWYSKDNREFRLAIEFVAGVQVAYPSEVVLGKLSK